MSQIEAFQKLGSSSEPQIELYLFGWFDASGNTGDYGLNAGDPLNTLNTLINTTYMFQPEPKFTLVCRPFQMNAAQFEFLQDHDLDTEAFLSQLGPMPEVKFSLDLAQYKGAATALAAAQEKLA